MSEILNVKRIGLATCAFVLLGAVAASAADLGVKRAPVYKAAVAPVSVYNWTGLYIGAYAGVGVNRSHIDDPRVAGLGGVVRLTGSGFTGGGTLGYNLQFWGSWVAGIEGDFGTLDLGHNVQEYAEGNFRYDSKASSIGTLRARLGFSDGPPMYPVMERARPVAGERPGGVEGSAAGAAHGGPVDDPAPGTLRRP